MIELATGYVRVPKAFGTGPEIDASELTEVAFGCGQRLKSKKSAPITGRAAKAEEIVQF